MDSPLLTEYQTRALCTMLNIVYLWNIFTCVASTHKIIIEHPPPPTHTHPHKHTHTNTPTQTRKLSNSKKEPQNRVQKCYKIRIRYLDLSNCVFVHSGMCVGGGVGMVGEGATVPLCISRNENEHSDLVWDLRKTYTNYIPTPSPSHTLGHVPNIGFIEYEHPIWGSYRRDIATSILYKLSQQYASFC